MNSLNKRKSTLLVCMGLVMALVLTVFAPAAGMEVQAARKVTTNYNWRKAPTVKTGTTTVTAGPMKYSNYKKKKVAPVGFIKFKAPKAGTYQFTFSNLMKKGDATAYTNGAVTFWTGAGSSKSIWPDKYLKVKTQGGKSSVLWLCSERESNDKITAGTFLTSRTATVKLKKGQVIYMDFNNSNTNICTLKIKKK